MELDSKQSSLPKSITILGFIANLLLAIGKGFVGYIAQSSALIADAGHSLSDLFSDLITYWSLHFSQQPRDENHPYGHGRFETVGSFIIALMLIATGIGVVWHTFQRIESPVIPGELALWAAGIHTVVLGTGTIGLRAHSVAIRSSSAGNDEMSQPALILH